MAVPMTSPSSLPSGGLHAPSISGALALALHGAKYTTFKFLSAFFPYLGHALVLLIIRTCFRELSSSLMNTIQCTESLQIIIENVRRYEVRMMLDFILLLFSRVTWLKLEPLLCNQLRLRANYTLI